MKIADIWKTSETLSMEMQLLQAAIKFNLKLKYVSRLVAVPT